MDSDELNRLLDERDKSAKRRGLSNLDRSVIAAATLLLGGVYKFAPNGDHDWIAAEFAKITPKLEQIQTDIQVMKQTSSNSTDELKDHEARIRILEAKAK